MPLRSHFSSQSFYYNYLQDEFSLESNDNKDSYIYNSVTNVTLDNKSALNNSSVNKKTSMTNKSNFIVSLQHNLVNLKDDLNLFCQLIKETKNPKDILEDNFESIIKDLTDLQQFFIAKETQLSQDESLTLQTKYSLQFLDRLLLIYNEIVQEENKNPWYKKLKKRCINYASKIDNFDVNNNLYNNAKESQ